MRTFLRFESSAKVTVLPESSLRFYARRVKHRWALPVYRRLRFVARELKFAARLQHSSETTIDIKDVGPPPSVQPHVARADVIICVHNALDDVKLCLESVVTHTGEPYSVILVDDGSADETRRYLAHFARSTGATLIRNEQAKGYTFAANQGLRRSKGDYVVLLNSDTIVAPEWLDRMIACAESEPRLGLVGPLSNAATWQSIPEITMNGEFADNKLPKGVTVADMGALVAQHSARLRPRVPFLDGFCLMVKREVIDQVGYFDEETFGRGYGEENDYGLRASNAGWQLAVADDAYVYHARSRGQVLIRL